MTPTDIFADVYYLLDMLGILPYIKAGAIIVTGMSILRHFWGR